MIERTGTAAAILLAGAMLFSCNRDEVIENDNAAKPQIILDSESGIYTVNAGDELTIAPAYRNAEGASYLWTVDGTEAATTAEFTRQWTETGEYYVTVTVSNKAGSSSEDLRVDVVDPAAPIISLPLAGNSLTLAVGSEYVFRPEISNSDRTDFKISWTLDGVEVGSDMDYRFQAGETGDYKLTGRAWNADGEDSMEISICVADKLPYRLSFPTPSYFQTSTTRYTFAGRPVFLSPLIENLAARKFSWTVDGVASECTARTFPFTPDAPGEYIVSLTVDETASASVKVVCVDATEAQRYRRPTAGSSAESTKVFEWIPAPGQFIGETSTGGMTGNETTLDQANAWASERLAKKAFVSLGGFGGYIIVGFDHSISKRDGQFDFAVMGNAFFNATTGSGGSNEPGVVYVMQDVNGNGLPDDEWYELRGSETGNAGTRQDYAVTYYRPAGPKMNVQWTDNYGGDGCVDYLSAFHRQDYYYPAWIEADSYTLHGTCLAARTSQDPSSGFWDNSAFGWGYADNKGSDDLGGPNGSGGEGQRNGFLIENAMYPDLTHVNLQYIDFIKVQTGVNSKSGWLGEVSTEVFNFQDLSLMPQ